MLWRSFDDHLEIVRASTTWLSVHVTSTKGILGGSPGRIYLEKWRRFEANSSASLVVTISLVSSIGHPNCELRSDHFKCWCVIK